MFKKVYSTIALGLLISYPLAASALSEDITLPKRSALGTLKIAVDQESAVTYTQIRGEGPVWEKGYGNCSGDLTLDMETICPTCNNCLDPDSPDVNEILLLSFAFDPPDPQTKVLPTTGQKYGFKLSNPRYFGSAKAATPEIVCHQEDPEVGYEFGARYHCAVAISVEVDSCASFEVWYDVMGTVSGSH